MRKRSVRADNEREESMSKQNGMILNWLESHDGITTFEATLNLGVCRISERIREIERLGFLIEHEPERTANGARVVRYKLVRVAYG
jgi:hypothetical protein